MRNIPRPLMDIIYITQCRVLESFETQQHIIIALLIHYANRIQEKTVTIVHNMLGINKEDLKLSKKKEDGVTYIVIAGKTTDEVTNKTYSINSRFSVDEKELDLDKVKSSLKNGLLYVTIPYNENKNKEEKESFINID